MKKSAIFFSFIAIASLACASPLNALTTAPHFYVVMQNQSQKDVTTSFQKGVGNVDLEPILNDHTPLPAHKTSIKYGVNFHPLDPQDTFNIVFTGEQDCTFNVAFYAPGNPKISMSGLGCYGGGYSIIDGGYTLLLYVSDIHLK
jgi:hypothetical protein